MATQSYQKRDLYRDITSRILSELEAGAAPWIKPWSAILCAEFDMDGELRHAGYIENWIRLLRADSRAFFTAASKAQAAADYLRGLALQ